MLTDMGNSRILGTKSTDKSSSNTSRRTIDFPLQQTPGSPVTTRSPFHQVLPPLLFLDLQLHMDSKGKVTTLALINTKRTRSTQVLQGRGVTKAKSRGTRGTSQSAFREEPVWIRHGAPCRKVQETIHFLLQQWGICHPHLARPVHESMISRCPALLREATTARKQDFVKQEAMVHRQSTLEIVTHVNCSPRTKHIRWEGQALVHNHGVAHNVV
jgi:hypothetical protein